MSHNPFKCNAKLILLKNTAAQNRWSTHTLGGRKKTLLAQLPTPSTAAVLARNKRFVLARMRAEERAANGRMRDRKRAY